MNCDECIFIKFILFSCEVAQFLNLSIQECRAILDRYNEEQNREVQKIKEKYAHCTFINEK